VGLERSGRRGKSSEDRGKSFRRCWLGRIIKGVYQD
jgi:hypothetical protein